MVYIYHGVDYLTFFSIIVWNMILSWERKGLHLLHLTALRGRLGQAFRNDQMRCYYTTIYLHFCIWETG